MEFKHTPKDMAEKLMEFIRDFSDDEEEMKEETAYVAELFDKLQKSEEFNALAHHLDRMFMYENFWSKDVTEECATDGIQIDGVIFRHGKDDYGLWEGFSLSKEDEDAIQKIFSKYDTDGCSIRGTKKVIAEELDSSERFSNGELAVLADGVLALIENVNRARHYLSDQNALDALGESIKRYQELNNKVCSIMKY